MERPRPLDFQFSTLVFQESSFHLHAKNTTEFTFLRCTFFTFYCFWIQDAFHNKCVCSERCGTLHRHSVQGQGTHPPSARSWGHTAASLTGTDPGHRDLPQPGLQPLLSGCPPPVTDWRFQGPAPLPQLRATLKGHFSSQPPKDHSRSQLTLPCSPASPSAKSYLPHFLTNASPRSVSRKPQTRVCKEKKCFDR